MTMAHPSQKTVNLVKEPQPKDVLLGRGVVKNSYAGNIQFRKHVDERKREYLHESCKKRKRVIAYEVFKKVQQSGGRFLKPVQVKLYGPFNCTDCWIEAPVETAIEKCMQALRDRERPLQSSPEGTAKVKGVTSQERRDEKSDPSEAPPDSRDKSKADGASETDADGTADLLLFLKHNPRDFQELEKKSTSTSNEGSTTTSSQPKSLPKLAPRPEPSDTAKALPWDELLARTTSPPPTVNLCSRLQAEILASQDLQLMEGPRIFQWKPDPPPSLVNHQLPSMLGLQARDIGVHQPPPLGLSQPPGFQERPPPHLVIPPAAAAQSGPNPFLRRPQVPPAQQSVLTVLRPPMRSQRRMLPTAANRRLPQDPQVARHVPTNNGPFDASSILSSVLRPQMPVPPAVNQNGHIALPTQQPTKISTEEPAFVSVQDILAVTGTNNKVAQQLMLAIFEEKNERRPSKGTIKRTSSGSCLALPRHEDKRAKIVR